MTTGDPASHWGDNIALIFLALNYSKWTNIPMFLQALGGCCRMVEELDRQGLSKKQHAKASSALSSA